MINILAITDRANYYIDQLGLREEQGIRPVPAEIVDIKTTSGKNNPVEILTSIAPGIYGRFMEDEKQIKFRIYNPQSDGPLQKKSININKSGQSPKSEKTGYKSIPKGTLLMLIFFVIILLLFIALIIISW
jgi:hypothetical protein